MAPIFLHGTGKGFDGSPSLSYPLYLEKAEALQLIIRELSCAGVDLTDREVVVDEVKLRRRRYLRVQKRNGTVEWKKIPDGDKSTRLAADAADRKRCIAVNWVGWGCYGSLGGVDVGRMTKLDERTGKRWTGGWTVWDYDFPDAARYVREQIQRQGRRPWYYGVFYDPVIIPRTKEAWESIMEPIDKKCDDYEARSKALDEAFEKARSDARKEAHDLLRAQVREFAQWLKREGAI